VVSLEPSSAQAARALLAFWRAAGADMSEAEAAYARGLVIAPNRTPAPAAVEPRKRAPTPTRPLEDARAAANEAADIAGLRAAVEAFEGCALRATARTTVFCDGAEDARVLLIGEAPGREEDEAGKPFVGRSGRLLDQMLATIGLDRKVNLLISNTIFWRPPGNRPPTQGEIAACLPFVERLIALMAPEALILAGGVAAQAVLKRAEGVMRLRGKRLIYSREGPPPVNAPVNAIVTLHPAYLLRRPQDKRLAWLDLLAIETLLSERGIRPGDMGGSP